MTNREYYGDRIVEVLTTGDYCEFFKKYLVSSYDFECSPGINCDLCTMMFAYWLEDEHENSETFKCDELVEVQLFPNLDIEWCKRYYAYQKNGKHYVWDDGATSKTTNNTAQVYSVRKVANNGISE